MIILKSNSVYLQKDSALKKYGKIYLMGFSVDKDVHYIEI